METQWPLVIFTLFVCVTCGLLGSMAIMALRGKGRELQMTGLVCSAVSLVIGGIGAFLHLEHWERIFNGFGHLTSGITQELIGCVALAVVLVLWFVSLRKADEPVPAWLSWATLVVAVGMVAATGHSYLMPARAAWGVALIVFYLANACLLGPIVTDLFEVMVFGAAAPMFWSAIVCAVIVLACAIVARKKAAATKTYLVVAAVAALATSLFFRVAVYQLGFSVFMLY